MIDLQLRRRDRYSIEIKLRHLVPESSGDTLQRLETRTRLSFFLPHGFNIRPDTTHPAEFFDDVKLYLRFDTPQLSAEEIVSRDSSVSPLARAETILSGSNAQEIGDAVAELKLLAAVCKTSLRDETTALLSEENPSNGAAQRFIALVDAMEHVQERVRGLHDVPGLPRHVAEHIDLVDECLSLLIENYLSRYVYQAADRGEEPFVAELQHRIRAQIDRRATEGYVSALEPDAAKQRREEYVYRVKMLKHYASSVLFFEIQRGNQAKRVEHMLYAIAAGLAMAVATGISFLTRAHLGSVGGTVFVVLVVAYMIKDRMKDGIRSLFQRTVGSFFYDTRTVFHDARFHRKLGVVKERVMFRTPSRVDPDVRRARARGGFEQALTATAPESVLEYSRLFRLHVRRLHRAWTRIQGVADIAIIDVKRLTRYLARQREPVPVPEKDGIRLEPARRVYHLNLVVSEDTGDGARHQKIRLVVDAGGIRRIERPSEPA